MILVTGGTGFLGSRLVNRLIAKNQPVRLLVRDPAVLDRRFAAFPQAVEVATGTITDMAAVTEAMRGIDRVIHLAAIGSPSADESQTATMMAVNVGGTANVLIAAGHNDVERVVIASSAAVYGDSPESPKVETMPTTPSSAYGVSKVAAEQLCEIYGKRFGYSTIALRFFNIYGPGQDPHGTSSMVVPLFVRKLRNREPIVLFGNGEQTRDFVFVDDCASALLLALDSNTSTSSRFNIGSGDGTTIEGLVTIIGEAVETNPLTVGAPARPEEIKESVAGIQKANSQLGFSPNVNLNAGIVTTVTEEFVSLKIPRE